VDVPGAWQFAILALAAYRLTRLAGWDEWPPVEKLRAKITGERWVHPVTILEADPGWAEAAAVPGEEPRLRDLPAGAEKSEGTGRVDAAELGFPGKQPTSPVAEVQPAYDRPTLAHLIHCPFCLGWWVSLACWGAWELDHRWSLVVLAPLAISGAVGLLAKNLDP
jgi:hypothetical protein